MQVPRIYSVVGEGNVDLALQQLLYCLSAARQEVLKATPRHVANTTSTGLTALRVVRSFIFVAICVTIAAIVRIIYPHAAWFSLQVACLAPLPELRVCMG